VTLIRFSSKKGVTENCNSVRNKQISRCEEPRYNGRCWLEYIANLSQTEHFYHTSIVTVQLALHFRLNIYIFKHFLYATLFLFYVCLTFLSVMQLIFNIQPLFEEWFLMTSQKILRNVTMFIVLGRDSCILNGKINLPLTFTPAQMECGFLKQCPVL
jgi:hypothetical protein